MTKIPDRAEFETTTDWLEAVAGETNSDVEVLKAVVSDVKPGIVSLPNSEKRRQLQRLLKDHTEFMTEKAGNADAWIEVYFERDGEEDSFYQYRLMNHNLARVNEEEVEIMKLIAKEEEMDVTEGENFIMGTQLDWDGVEEELRLMRKVLNEVYGVTIEDIDRAVERREDESISWTEV